MQYKKFVKYKVKNLTNKFSIKIFLIYSIHIYYNYFFNLNSFALETLKFLNTKFKFLIKSSFESFELIYRTFFKILA